MKMFLSLLLLFSASFSQAAFNDRDLQTYRLFLKESGGNDTITLQPPVLGASYTLTLPVDDGNSNECLKTNGSGVLSWSACAGSSATTALDNLASTAVNADIIPDSDQDTNLGSSSLSWLTTFTRNVKFQGSTSGELTFGVPATVSSYSLLMPSAQGGSNTYLKNDGSGNLSWSSASASPLTTKGDLWGYSSVDARVPVGSNDQYLASESTATLGVEYRTFRLSPDTAENYSLSQNTNSGAHTWAFTLKDSSNGSLSSTNFAKFAFRNDGSGAATSASTTYSAVTVTTGITLTIPSGATLGHENAREHIVYVLLINNSGTAELAVTSTLPAQDTIISTTAIDSASDSDSGIYSTAARTNVAFRLLNYYNSTQTTAGTWDSTPTNNAGSTKNLVKAPVPQSYLSGSNSYTAPLGTAYLIVELYGAGAGGGPSGTSGTGGTPTSGGNTVFGPATANGGGASGTTAGSNSTGGTGGSFTVNAPAVMIGGGAGGDGHMNIYGPTTTATGGGVGGSNCAGGAGGAAEAGNGGAGKTNTGGGGSGGGTTAGVLAYPGTGGGAGACIRILYPNPGRTSFTANVGVHGNGGTTGTGGFAGGNGADGAIYILAVPQ